MTGKQIGVIVGRENTWPHAFIEEVNRRNLGVTAEFARLAGTAMAEASPYAVLIDRISHEIPYYRTYLKNAAVMGSTVINDPFLWSADDKFFGACLATRLGVPHPRTIVLPNKSYVDGVVQESLRNLAYPIPWEQHVAAVGGFPVILKPAWGGGFKSVFKLHTMEQLWRAYDMTGTETMMLQEFIEWEKYVRCLCIGREQVMSIRFDVNRPYPHRYIRDENYLTADESRQVHEYALKLVTALGYDMNTVEFALRDGVPYAIDFTNPAPDFDLYSLTEYYFEWVVKAMADFTIGVALGERAVKVEHHWSSMLTGVTAE